MVYVQVLSGGSATGTSTVMLPVALVQVRMSGRHVETPVTITVSPTVSPGWGDRIVGGIPFSSSRRAPCWPGFIPAGDATPTVASAASRQTRASDRSTDDLLG